MAYKVGPAFHNTNILSRISRRTMSVGFGEMPEDSVSLTVIAVTSVGLGVPAIVALVTVGYLALYKPQPTL